MYAQIHVIYVQGAGWEFPSVSSHVLDTVPLQSLLYVTLAHTFPPNFLKLPKQRLNIQEAKLT